MNASRRNIGIIAHVDAGKTTVSERILYYTGKTHRIGEVHAGTAVMDSDPQERRRGITINSAATSVFWRDAQINLIDTPGHIDFNIEVNRALRVLDGAVVVFDAVAGVEPQTETNWRLADQYGVVRLGFINKLDRVGADVERTLEMMRQRLGTLPLLLQLPLGEEAHFRGVIDLVNLQAIVWPSSAMGMPCEVGEIPSELRSRAEALRLVLVEAVAEHDEAALQAYSNGVPVTPEQLRACIRKATLLGGVVPVLLGAAYCNRGIEPLLDAMVSYLPGPGEVRREGEPEADLAGPFVALAFKVINDVHGALTLLRVYRGRVEAGEVVLNTTTGRRERITRIYEMHADKRVERRCAVAGDIVAVLGMKDTSTGHTLADPQALSLERIVVGEPVIDIAIEPRTQADQQALSLGLQALGREDPSLRVRHDAELGQVILSAMGELQIEVALENLRTRHGVQVATGAPRVAYRETIEHVAEVSHVYKKQTGGPGQFAALTLRLSPATRGAGVHFENHIRGGAIPREFIPSVEAGVRRAAQHGVLAGFACVDFTAALLDGSYHERDSSTIAFEWAAAAAFREAAAAAQVLLLEPVMAVEVITPAAYLGDCIGDLARRRGEIRAQHTRGSTVTLAAQVPLQEMFGYIGTLRALSSGRAQYSMQLDHYGVAPRTVTERIAAR